jgi:hypothetical protein
MPRIAIQFSESVLSAISQMTGVDDMSPLDNVAYAVVEPLSPTEYNFKLMTEDEIFEAVKTDPDMQIVSF